jgi:spore germination protein GerM
VRVAAIAIVVVLAGCGVSSRDELSTADADEVPYDLLAPEVPTSTSTTEPRRETARAAVWFVAGGSIVPLFRDVPGPADLEGLLAALVAGPTEGEARLGARSSIAADAGGITARIDRRTAVIELPAGFASAAPREQLLGLAQLVYTATELASVDTVRFDIGGAQVAVPRADGSVTDEPLRRIDYQSLKV